MEKNENNNPKNLIFGKYKLIKKIGSGSFGTVFLGINVYTKEKVAVKIEEDNKNAAGLKEEAFRLINLKGIGLPTLKNFGKRNKFNILVQTLLGQSLYDIFNNFDQKFTLKDNCMIGIQILERLQHIHSKNYIHRDIKPQNFLVGLENDEIIYIIDFGLAKKYKSDRGKHINFTTCKKIIGTPRFCSINAMAGKMQSRRDDLESFMYLILYFFKGNLPWQGLKIESREKRFEIIAKMKKNINFKNICQGLPEEIYILCQYIKKLSFKENPKYFFMRTLFLDILQNYNLDYDNNFSWVQKKYIKSLSNFQCYHSKRDRLINHIRESLSKKEKKKNYTTEIGNNQDDTLNTIIMENPKSIQDDRNKPMDLNQNSVNKNDKYKVDDKYKVNINPKYIGINIGDSNFGDTKQKSMIMPHKKFLKYEPIFSTPNCQRYKLNQNKDTKIKNYKNLTGKVDKIKKMTNLFISQNNKILVNINNTYNDQKIPRNRNKGQILYNLPLEKPKTQRNGFTTISDNKSYILSNVNQSLKLEKSKQKLFFENKSQIHDAMDTFVSENFYENNYLSYNRRKPNSTKIENIVPSNMTIFRLFENPINNKLFNMRVGNKDIYNNEKIQKVPTDIKSINKKNNQNSLLIVPNERKQVKKQKKNNLGYMKFSSPILYRKIILTNNSVI
jgi:serine/threonine protein kinase